MSGKVKTQRHQRLNELLQENPFLTDEELARLLGVSIQTIRLDRLERGIPELRRRVQEVAERQQNQVKALGGHEFIGELLDLELGQFGVSLLEIGEDMVLTRSKIARGHYLFAQANSLAIAIVDAENVVTGSARVHFSNPVHLGDKVMARAQMITQKGNKCYIEVKATVNMGEVFSGKFIVFILAAPEGEGELQ